MTINELIERLEEYRDEIGGDAEEQAAEKSEASILCELPMTKVTAMVSPMARPSPRNEAPTRPRMP